MMGRFPVPTPYAGTGTVHGVFAENSGETAELAPPRIGLKGQKRDRQLLRENGLHGVFPELSGSVEKRRWMGLA